MVRSEAEFLAAIDCRFPYDDQSTAHALIEEGCAISADAAFMVVHELARRPRGATTSDATCLALLECFDEQFSHPIKSNVLDVARRMVRRQSVACDELRAVMHAIAQYPGQYNALGLVSFAAEDDCMEAIEAMYNDIVRAWEQSGLGD